MSLITWAQQQANQGTSNPTVVNYDDTEVLALRRELSLFREFVLELDPKLDGDRLDRMFDDWKRAREARESGG